MVRESKDPEEFHNIADLMNYIKANPHKKGFCVTLADNGGCQK